MNLQNSIHAFLEKQHSLRVPDLGWGAAFTHLLIQNDWKLYLADLRPDSLEEYKTKGIQTFELDVSNRADYEVVVSEISKNEDHIDLLINNAGIGDGAFFKDYNIDHWEKMIEINLMGTFYGSRLIIPLMEGPAGGLIINIGSAAGFMNSPRHVCV